jgi:hypothetical protein
VALAQRNFFLLAILVDLDLAFLFVGGSPAGDAFALASTCMTYTPPYCTCWVLIIPVSPIVTPVAIFA